MTADLTDLADLLQDSPWHNGSDARDESPATRPWNHTIDELLQIRLLEDDWDGLGAKAPAGLLVDSALRMAGWMEGRGFAAPARIVPGLTGSVVFEWQTDDGAQLEVELTEPARGRIALFRAGETTIHHEI